MICSERIAVAKVNRYWNSGSGRKGTGMFKTTMTNLTPDLSSEVEYIKARVKHTAYDPSRGSSREHVWTDDAACKGSDPELFQLLQEGDPGAGDAKRGALIPLNRERIAKAIRICESCPIKERCLEEATPSDLYWSVRGGQTPTKFSGEVKMVPMFKSSEWLGKPECPEHGSRSVSTRHRTDQKGSRYTSTYCGVCSTPLRW